MKIIFKSFLLLICFFQLALAQKAIVSPFIGSGRAGYKDGEGIDAMLNSPNGLCVDKSGNVYISDQYNNCIRKATPDGIVTTFAGSVFTGMRDGKGTLARFNNPTGLCADKSGNIYVCDLNNNAIRKITPSGDVTTIAGNGFKGLKDGKGSDAMFYNPLAITCDDAGNLFVADNQNYCIRKITPDGTVTTLAGDGTSGYKDGTGNFAKFNAPVSIAIDKKGNLYIVDCYNSAIRKITPSGFTSTLISKELKGFTDSTVVGKLAFSMSNIRGGGGVSVDQDGDLYIADGSTHAVLFVDMNKKVIRILAGNGFKGLVDGEGTNAKFNNPVELGISPKGEIYVVDNDNHAIRKITIEKEKVKEKKFIIAGMITDITTLKGIQANIEIEKIETSSAGKEKNINSNFEGRYREPIQPGSYRISVTSDGYLPFEKEITITKEGEEVTIFNAELTKIEIGAKAVLTDIRFKPNSADFDGSFSESLKKIGNYLKKNPNLKVQVNGHTDIGGTQEFNIKLSTERAKSVVVYLKALGVNPNQLSFKGFGNAKPIASNDTAEGKAINRRTEFEIIGK